MTKKRWSNDQKRELGGWFLFLFCGIFFLLSGIQHKDFYTIIGTIIFMVACLFFMIPYFGKS